jgi:ubiquinone/menaquinone biosynthesis C-methylase UbiE
MSAYDAAASSFDRHRALPESAAEAIRSAVLAAIAKVTRPRLLDLGAGTGRIGWPFVSAEDDYVGVDLSLGMLQAFMRRSRTRTGTAPRLAQADGQHLPFRDAAFDAVMLIQVFGGMRGWRRLLAEARRVLRPDGTLVVGRSVAPEGGVDARMKQRLASILNEMRAPADHTNAHEGAQRWLEAAAPGSARVIAAEWEAERTPRDFLDRHRTGARFSALPESIRDEALRRLGVWAAAAFGSLDAAQSERHRFELRVFKFQEGTGH